MIRVITLAACLAIFASSVAAAGSPSGEQLFRTRGCSVCHSLTPGKNMNGPSLSGIAGRAIGKASGYKYSADFQEAEGVWDAQKLGIYLTDPKAMFPSSRMAVSISDSADRIAIIEFLTTQ